MKKIHIIGLLCIPLLLFLGLRTSKAIGVSGQETAPTRGPSYHYETESIDMVEVGKLLERLGKEIQQKGEVTAGDHSFALKGIGGLEMSVISMRGGTGIQLEFGAGIERPARTDTSVSYARSNRAGTAAEFAEIVAKVGESLASKSAFVMEDHTVAFKGPASTVQRITESMRQRGRGQPYTFYLDVTFGETRFPVPNDEVDAVEAEQRGLIKEVAIKESVGVDKDGIVKLYEKLGSDLKAGRVSVGDTELPVGENIQFGLSHLVSPDGKTHRIRVGLQFGEAPPRKRPTGPRYSKEFFDEPMKKVGALLKRLGSEILETGTFKLGENAFTVKDTATYEIIASERGFSIELSYTESKKE